MAYVSSTSVSTPQRQPPYRRWFTLSALLLLWSWSLGQGCNCEADISIGGNLEVKLVKPQTGLVADQVAIAVTITPAEKTHFVQVFLSAPKRGSKPALRRQIAELYHPPYAFKWNSFQVDDGFYSLQAVAFDQSGLENSSRRIQIQISNNPPELWFVNCFDGQFIRGKYALVVSLLKQETRLKAAPTLYVNGKKAAPTQDRQAPYRFPLPTESYEEGKQLSLAVEGEDLNGKRRRIVCYPKVDNTPPTLRFRTPAKDDEQRGRRFMTDFEALDRFGIQEVRLWVDGSPCRNPPLPAEGETTASTAPPCPTAPEQWRGTRPPFFEIDVTLSKTYQSLQPIILTARAVDKAGNLSKPVTRRLRIDPLLPEIFIRAPGKSEMLEDTATLTARVTDNDQLSRVEFLLRQNNRTTTLFKTTLSAPSFTHTMQLTQIEKRLGFGRKQFIVRATDRSGNRSESTRLFSVGCVDATDCPLGKTCYKFRCLVPAKLNQPCREDLPCDIGLACVQGEAPFCSSTPNTFCRKRCNPGNKFVTSDECAPGFFCSKNSRACMPGDKCRPLSNDCGRGKQCVPFDADAGICFPVGNVPIGSSCEEDCNVSRNCRSGDWCVFLANTGGTACMKICVVNDPRYPCPGSQRCAPLQWVFGGSRLRFGVCQ